MNKSDVPQALVAPSIPTEQDMDSEAQLPATPEVIRPIEPTAIETPPAKFGSASRLKWEDKFAAMQSRHVG